MDWDYIVVGAGASGCVVAARLSEDPGLRVLLVEAGGSDRSPIIAMPAALSFAYQSREFGWGYLSGPEPHLNGREIDEKRGRVLGGSSSINAMIFNRGNPMDFEGWAALGLADWDYAHVLPYFRKMETFEGGEDAWRGGSGPMRISRAPVRHKLFATFLEAGRQVGFEVTPDHNGYRQEGLHIAQAFIHRGRRWSAARGYLHPARGRSNVTVWTGALVRRVVVENGAARGIEIDRRGEIRRVECAREVVLCAGAINTPQLLMLSGIGNADDLRPLGIEVSAHVPSVGRNLENHPGVNVQFSTRHEDSLVAELGPLGQARLGAEWLLRRTGLGASNFFEAGAFLRSRPEVAYPNLQFEFLPLTRRLKGGRLVAVPGFQFWLDLSRPESRGRVRLRSADPKAAPSIVFNHLEDRRDLRELIDGVRIARQIAAQPAFERVRTGEIAPGADVQSDADLERFIRAGLGTSYHPSGTCRMGTDPEAVVDGEGRMAAIRRLRVVDASIMPRIVTANLAASVIMMAEKLSDRIRERPPLPPSEAPFFASRVAVPGAERESRQRPNHQRRTRVKTDVLVIGGGAIGAAVACFLKVKDPSCRVVVAERDATYALASTPRASGGIRRLFSLPENIELSNYSIPFFASFPETMSTEEHEAEIACRQGGYLFIVPPDKREMLRRTHNMQAEHGVNVVWLEPDDIKARWPSMNVADLGAATHSPDDGWIDPNSVLHAFRRKARSLGAEFRQDEVTGLERSGNRVTAAGLASGERIEAEWFVNAAGAWAKDVCAMLDIVVPIEPLRRYEHYFECQDAIEPLPYIKDVHRLAFRPEGRGYTGGLPTLDEPRGYNFEVDHSYFDNVVWPALAHRFPQFERTKCKNTMPGLYDQNDFDGNVIIGPGAGGLINFQMLSGFSGHGLMHAPGCGRAMAELILDGGYQTIDLTRLGWQRLEDGTPLREQGII